MEINDQLNNSQLLIELELPLITQDDGTTGYDICALVKKAVQAYDLDPDCGIQVDYWSNSLQMYVLAEDLFTNATAGAMVMEEDLIYCENQDRSEKYECKTCLLIRLKNCTGNIIRLEYV